MKFWAYILLLFMFLSSCSNDEEPLNTNEIVGKWQLSEELLDPGDGSGTFMSVESDKTITFLPDGTFTSNGTTCFMGITVDEASSGVYNTNTMIFTPDDCSTVFDISYKLEAPNLILYYPCIEPCAQKFRKIE